LGSLWPLLTIKYWALQGTLIILWPFCYIFFSSTQLDLTLNFTHNITHLLYLPNCKLYVDPEIRQSAMLFTVTGLCFFSSRPNRDHLTCRRVCSPLRFRWERHTVLARGRGGGGSQFGRGDRHCATLVAGSLKVFLEGSGVLNRK
jgi:hypothetical protein